MHIMLCKFGLIQGTHEAATLTGWGTAALLGGAMHWEQVADSVGMPEHNQSTLDQAMITHECSAMHATPSVPNVAHRDNCILLLLCCTLKCSMQAYNARNAE